MRRPRYAPRRRRQRGASLVEYVMGVGFVVVVALGGISYFGERVNDSVTNSGDDIVEAGAETPSCQSAAESGAAVGVIIPASGAPYGVTGIDGEASPCDLGDAALPSRAELQALCPGAAPSDDLMVFVSGGGEMLAFGDAGAQSWSPCGSPEPESTI